MKPIGYYTSIEALEGILELLGELEVPNSLNDKITQGVSLLQEVKALQNKLNTHQAATSHYLLSTLHQE